MIRLAVCYSDIYSFIFLRDDIKLMPFKCVSAGQSLRLHIVVVKLSNCRVERSRTSFLWIYTSKRLMPLPSWLWDMDDHWWNYLLYRVIPSIYELKQWLIRLIQIWCNDQDVIDTAIGVKDLQHAFVRRALISSTSCKLTHSDHLWLVLCDWTAQIFRTFCKKNI